MELPVSVRSLTALKCLRLRPSQQTDTRSRARKVVDTYEETYDQLVALAIARTVSGSKH